MKTTLLIIALLLGTLCGFSQKKGFVINARNMYGGDGSKIYLVLPQGEKKDTVAQASLQDGKFSFEGQVDGVVLADICSQGKRVLSFFLENEEYNIDMGISSIPRITGGGKDQQIKQAFDDIYIRHESTLKELSEYYRKIEESKDSALIAVWYEACYTVLKLIEKEENLYIATHPDEMTMAYVTDKCIGKSPDETVKLRYDLLGAKAKATSYGQEVGTYVQTCIGATVPDFTVETPDAKPLNLYDLKGKIKIIDFWASWCPPCRGETPRLKEMYKKYHDQGLEILSVTMDEDKQSWKKSMEQDGMNWKNGFPEGAFNSIPARQYMVQVIPFMVILDENNKVLAKGLMGEKLQEKVEELMNK